MRIAFIGQKTIGIKGERTGGIEKHVDELATRLADRDHEVFVYARAHYQEDRPREYHGVRMIYVPTIYRKNLEAIVHTLLATLHAWFMPYDIIHYHGVGPSTLTFFLRILKPKTRIVTTFHSQDRFHQKWGLLARLYLHFGEIAACWFPHVCIAVSHVIQVYCRTHYRRQVVYVPNGAEPQTVKEFGELENFGLQPDKYFLNVGRVVRHKGLHYLIDAYQKLSTEKKLVIVGGAAEGGEEYFEALKKRVAGDKNILFLGYQSGETLKQLFSHAYIYCQPSESEGLAVVVLEAMSFGTPVLVSDIPENLEAMHRAGFSFKNKNINDLADQMQYCLRHPQEVDKASKKSVEAVKTFFNWDRITNQVEEVYRTVRH